MFTMNTGPYFHFQEQLFKITSIHTNITALVVAVKVLQVLR